MQAINIPPLFCPFDLAIHSEANEIERSTIAWLFKYGFIQSPEDEMRFRAARYGTLASMVYPERDLEIVQIISDWMTWLFLFDDERVELPALASNPVLAADNMLRCYRVIENPYSLAPAQQDDHFISSLQNLCLRFREVASDLQVARVNTGFVEYFMAAACEASYMAYRRSPGVQEYLTLRELSADLRSAAFVFIELGGGYELPAETWYSADMQALTRSAARVVGLTNDILSGVREFDWSGAVNLQMSLAHHHGISLQQAVEQVSALYRTEMNSFVDISARLRTRGDSRVVDYIRGLEQWIRGHIEWCMTTGRYAASARPTGVTRE